MFRTSVNLCITNVLLWTEIFIVTYDLQCYKYDYDTYILEIRLLEPPIYRTNNNKKYLFKMFRQVLFEIYLRTQTLRG